MAAATPSLTAKEPRGPRPPVIAALLALVIAVALFLLYALWEFWPTADLLGAKTAMPVHIFGIHRLVTTEVRLFVVVAIGGMLGGLLHSTRSFAWYVGHSGLKWRWIPYYIVTLTIGAGLATVVYVVIRGGLFSGKAGDGTAAVNPYGIVAISTLVGLFTEQALEMLRRVATDFFAAAPQGADSAQQLATPLAVTGVAADVAQTTATLAGRLDPDGEPTTYHFELGPTTAYAVSTPTATCAEAGPTGVTAPVTGLLPGTQYHFRLVAVSATAGTVKGADAVFTTAP